MDMTIWTYHIDIYHMDIRNKNFRFLFKISLLSLKFFKTLNVINNYFKTNIYFISS